MALAPRMILRSHHRLVRTGEMIPRLGPKKWPGQAKISCVVCQQHVATGIRCYECHGFAHCRNPCHARQCRRCHNWLCGLCWPRHSGELCLGMGRQCVVSAFYLGRNDTRKCCQCNGLAHYLNNIFNTHIVCCHCCLRYYCRHCWPAHGDAQCNVCHSSLPATLDSMARDDRSMYFPHGSSMVSGPDEWYPWCGVCSKPSGQNRFRACHRCEAVAHWIQPARCLRCRWRLNAFCLNCWPEHVRSSCAKGTSPSLPSCVGAVPQLAIMDQAGVAPSALPVAQTGEGDGGIGTTVSLSCETDDNAHPSTSSSDSEVDPHGNHWCIVCRRWADPLTLIICHECHHLAHYRDLFHATRCIETQEILCKFHEIACPT